MRMNGSMGSAFDAKHISAPCSVHIYPVLPRNKAFISWPVKSERLLEFSPKSILKTCTLETIRLLQGYMGTIP